MYAKALVSAHSKPDEKIKERKRERDRVHVLQRCLSLESKGGIKFPEYESGYSKYSTRAWKDLGDLVIKPQQICPK